MMIYKEVTNGTPEAIKALVAERSHGDALGVWIVGENSTPDNPDPILGLMRDGDMAGAISMAELSDEDVLWLYA